MKALKLYTKKYTVKGIEEMTSVSKATLNKELTGAKNKKRTCVAQPNKVGIFFSERIT